MRYHKKATALFLGSAVVLLFFSLPVLAQWSEPTQSPPQGNTKGLIWNAPAAAQDASFNILGTGNAGILEAGSPAGLKGNTKIGGDATRPGIYFDKTNGGYDSRPNIYRYLGTGATGEQNAIVIRNEVNRADLLLSGGPDDGRVYVKDSKLCLGGRENADCISAWSQIQLDSAPFVHLLDDPAGDANDRGHILLDGTITTTGRDVASVTEGWIKIGNQSSGSVNRPGIWFKNKAGNFDSGLPNIYRYAGTHATPGASDSLLIRNDVSGANITFDTTGDAWVESKDPVRVYGKALGSFSTASEIGNKLPNDAGVFAGYFKALLDGEILNHAYLGAGTSASSIAGLFRDEATQNTAIVGSALYAAHFTGPAWFNGLLRLGYNSVGGVHTNSPTIETPEDLFFILSKSTPKRSDFYIYDNSVSAANQLLHLDQIGNLFIKGNLYANDAQFASTPVYANVTLLGLGTSTDTDSNIPPGSDGEAKLYLGTSTGTTDETLFLRHKNYPRKANLFVQGNFTVEGTTTGGTHTPAFSVAYGTGNTTIKGSLAAKNGATITGGFSVNETDGDNIFWINPATLAASFSGDITARGHIYAHTSTHVGDIAEPTLLHSAEPGDVIITDKTQKKKSATAYDKRVIGVYSENPSLILANIEGRQPLAVSGFVNVNASAENGPIEPGDLLVSSSMPGHAMRCAGAEKCFGAVIGKALEPLEKGTGKILMIVALQ